MQLRYWGTRGSLPSPGPSTVRYGGNTSCVEARLDDGTRIILDAGSGIRSLGATLGPCEATLLLTHYHWDHIQGLPFFVPAYAPASNLTVFGPESCGMGPDHILEGQMAMPYFPATPSQLQGVTRYAGTPSVPFQIGSATVRSCRVCHPSVTLGYRIEADGASVVYISDDEVDEATPELLETIISLARDADVLLHDCQYTEGEYSTHRGWGHSTPSMAVRVAREARVKHLVLFHHDPTHSDDQLEAIASEARAIAGRLKISIAAEGKTLALKPARIHAAASVLPNSVPR